MTRFKRFEVFILWQTLLREARCDWSHKLRKLILVFMNLRKNLLGIKLKVANHFDGAQFLYIIKDC